MPTQRHVRITCSWLLLLAGAHPAGLHALEIPPAGATLQIDVAADTYIRSGPHAATNFSDAPDLRAIRRGEDRSQILLRFQVPESDARPDSAYVWIRTTADHTRPVENAAYLVPDNRWNPKTITWNSRPRTSDELDAWVTENNHSIKIDVTQQVLAAMRDDGLLSIAIRAPHDVGSDGASVYHSIETPGALSSMLLLHFDEPKALVRPGQSIQEAIDAVHRRGGGQVILAAGKHMINRSISMHSHVTLRGQGPNRTAIILDRKADTPLLVGTRVGSITQDVTIRDLTLDGQQLSSQRSLPGDTDRDTVRGETFGILFTDQQTGNKFERIRISNVAITRCAMGIHFKGVTDLRILNSQIRGNGCLVGFDHNIYFRRARNALLKNLNISDCTAGNGFNLSTDCFNVVIDRCDASNNHFRGIRFEAKDGGGRMMILNCTANHNGRREKQPGIRVANVRDFVILNTTANNNGAAGIFCVGARDGRVKGCTTTGNAGKNIDLRNCRNVEVEDN